MRLHQTSTDIPPPFASAITPGMMMRTSANVLMKVKVTCVREAMVTLQQLTATTNAGGTQRGALGGEVFPFVCCCCCGQEGLEPLTYSEDANQPDQRCGSGARCEEGLHHVATKRQGHIGSDSRPADRNQLVESGKCGTCD